MGCDGAGARDRKRHGRHYTPVALARFLAGRVAARVPRGLPLIQVLDPACGEGELLFAARAVLAARYPDTPVGLVGYDVDRPALAIAAERAEASGIDIDLREGNFLAEFADLTGEQFDLVIANPPYVRTQQLGGAQAQVLSRRFGLSGRIDLTHPFVAALPSLIRPGGVLGLLCANRFLTTRAGANLRAVLSTHLSPVELYDLGDTKLFEAAVLPAVTVAIRGATDEMCRYVSVYEAESGRRGRSGVGGASEFGAEVGADTAGGGLPVQADLFAALVGSRDVLVRYRRRLFSVEVGTLDTGDAGRSVSVVSDRRPDAGRSVWRMSRGGRDAWLVGVGERTWKTFGEVARIRVGIKTNADRVFISDHWPEPAPEAELLRELITHHDTAPWRLARARSTRVLYPYDITRPHRVPVDLRRYPRAAAYLDTHREALLAREYLTASGREWFEHWVPHRPHLWGAPKVVFPDISDRPRFALDRSGAVVNGDCYWITLADLVRVVGGGRAEDLAYLLMGVANSTLGLRFYDAVCGNRLYAGRRRWITQYVSRFPLPDPETRRAAEVVRAVRRLVEEREPDPLRSAELDELVWASFFQVPPAPGGTGGE